MIGGWTPGEGAPRAPLGRLAVGVPDDGGELKYAGKVGTGFTETTLAMLMRELEPLRARRRRRSTGRQPPEGHACSSSRGSSAGVEFAEWTRTDAARACSRACATTSSRTSREKAVALRSARMGTVQGMARAIWSGAISFGLVNIPVKLYSAVSKKTVRFHQLDSKDNTRIQQKRVNPEHGRGGPYEQLVKGFELSPDRYVVIKPEELDAVEPKKTRTIDIEDFVEIDEIDPIYYDHPYYLAPGTGRGQGLQLLLEAMKATEPGRHRPRGDPLEGAAGGHPPARRRADDGDDALRRRGRAAGGPRRAATAWTRSRRPRRRWQMARQLIESLSTDFDPAKYTRRVPRGGARDDRAQGRGRGDRDPAEARGARGGARPDGRARGLDRARASASRSRRPKAKAKAKAKPKAKAKAKKQDRCQEVGPQASRSTSRAAGCGSRNLDKVLYPETRVHQGPGDRLLHARRAARCCRTCAAAR